MKQINLVLPHQLFYNSPLLNNEAPFAIVEEFLFFKQFQFHKQKIAFHRATMKAYEKYLTKKGLEVIYIESKEAHSDIRKLPNWCKSQGFSQINFIDPTDDWINRRLQKASKAASLTLQKLENPLFLNTTKDLASFFKPEKKKFFQTKFYIEQRKKRKLLLDKDGKALGGKWSFDSENRKKYPTKKIPPAVQYPKQTALYKEAVVYTNKNFPNNPGLLQDDPLYPIDRKQSLKWLNQFLEQRFHEFGPYEDAMVAEHSILHHSVLTPMLNIGLIQPQEVIDRIIVFAEKNDVPLNTTEGFVRQVIGWREFIRGMYEVKGRQQRTTNFWKFKKKIPASFYNGTTGIPPVDHTIKKILQTGYCHHIERLMVLGNFMVLCEFDPDEVYKWFMELFIDAYDWVMVPNVYGMSQYADGGLLSTKPYISSSNYILKMSNYKKGDWQKVWDGLFWRFMDIHRDFFLKNPRLGMLIRTFDKMNEEKKSTHHQNAEAFLAQLELQLT